VVFRNLIKVSYLDPTHSLTFFSYNIQGKTGISATPTGVFIALPSSFLFISEFPIYQYNANLSIYQLETNRPQCLYFPRTSHYQFDCDFLVIALQCACMHVTSFRSSEKFHACTARLCMRGTWWPIKLVHLSYFMIFRAMHASACTCMLCVERLSDSLLVEHT
jgi:hypothetical protein